MAVKPREQRSGQPGEAGSSRKEKPCSLFAAPTARFSPLLFPYGIKALGRKIFPQERLQLSHVCNDVPQHLGCRITVKIKASLISSVFHVCSPSCLPVAGQGVSFILDSNDAGKINAGCVASPPPGKISPSSFNRRTDGNVNWEWETLPTSPTETEASEGRSSCLFPEL